MRPTLHHLKLRKHLEAGCLFHVARYVYSGQSRPFRHDHDFAEVFWIAQGKCRHTLLDHDEILYPGDIRFVLPAHVHGISSYGAEPMRLTNIAFPADIIPAWRKAYPLLEGHFFWTGATHPVGSRIDSHAVDELEALAWRLASRTGDLFFLHQFLMNLFEQALPSAPDARDLPAWLKQGLAALEDRAVLGEGVHGFVKACGRSPEHVSRWCRKHLGKTPGQLVNEGRIKESAHALRMTDLDILNIMLDCGYSSPAHFYMLFRQKYGVTPRAYRMQMRRLA